MIHHIKKTIEAGYSFSVNLFQYFLRKSRDSVQFGCQKKTFLMDNQKKDLEIYLKILSKARKKFIKQSKEKEDKIRKKRFKNVSLIVLNKWYRQHDSNPYATKLEITELASRSMLSAQQVTKWLQNRRRYTKIKKKKLTK